MNNEEHIQTLTNAINLLYKERKDGLLKDLREPRFKNLVSQILWAATEDRYDENKDDILFKKWKQDFWSVGAIRQYERNKKDGEIKNKFTGLRHDHVIEKQEIRKFLDDKKTLSKKDIEKVIRQSVAAIVTTKEHDGLNRSSKKGFTGGSRYRDQKIEVWKVEWDDKGKIKPLKETNVVYKISLNLQ